MGVFLFFVRILEALALYATLFFIFYNLWRFTNPRVIELGKKITLQELDDESSVIRTYELSSNKISIGRRSDANLFLNNSSVSASHAEIKYLDGQWWIEDLGSTNGTFLNENNLTMPVALLNNDVVRFGLVKIRIQI